MADRILSGQQEVVLNIPGRLSGFDPKTGDQLWRCRGIEDGYFFDVISNGIRTMPAYGSQIPVVDRWAITAYIRALQRSQNATEGDIPANILADLQQGGAAAGQ